MLSRKYLISSPPPKAKPPAHAMADVDHAPSPVDELADLRASALLPQQLLNPGEVIILLIKPSPWSIVLESMRFLLVVIMLTGIYLLLHAKGLFTPIGSLGKVDVLVLALAICLIRLVVQFLQWLSRTYVLTDCRVITIEGFWRVQVFETSLKKIQNTLTLFSFRERLFALGTLAFATAGTGSYESIWRTIAKPLEVHQVVIQTLKRYR